jgi:hypothetical protein
MTHKQARSIIVGLLDAGRIGVLAECRDDGLDVDVPLDSKGQEISLDGAERFTDKVIRQAFRALTGDVIDKSRDPVEFINE